MNKIKCVFLVICFAFFSTISTAQVKDSIPPKTSFFAKLNFSKVQLPKIHIPKLSFFKKDTSIAVAAKQQAKSIADKPVEIKSQDTASKKNFFSKIQLPKWNIFKKDSTKTKEPTSKIEEQKSIGAVVEKPTDTSTKKSFISKINFSKLNVFKKDTTKIKDIAAKTEEKKIEDKKLEDKKIEAQQSIATVEKPANLKSNKVSNEEKTVKIKVPDAYVVPEPAPIVVAEKPVELVKTVDTNKTVTISTNNNIKDTIKKASWFSKLSFTKKATFNTDTSLVKGAVEGFFKAFSKNTNKKIANKKEATLSSDSVATDITKSLANGSQKKPAIAVSKLKDTNSLYKTVQQKFLQYTATTTISLFAGANFSKQTVDAGNYVSNFNYRFSDVNEDVYKTGYLGGIRLDGMMKKKHEYSLSLSLAKITTGSNYTTATKLSPVVGSFLPFKAEDHFFVVNIAAHYKKLIPYGDRSRFKFYFVAGPSIDARLSNTSLDNQVTNAYKQIFMKGDLGLEFNNQSLYTLYFHYQHNIGSITKSPIVTNINTFQLGILVKAADLL